MTTIDITCPIPRTTRFERMLLHAASRLNGIVAIRLEHRADAARAAAARTVATDARADAQALAATGILPR